MPLDVVIAADLGPNPAPLCELVWALHRQRGMRVRAIHLVVNARTLGWLHAEFLGPHGALGPLFPPNCLPTPL